MSLINHPGSHHQMAVTRSRQPRSEELVPRQRDVQPSVPEQLGLEPVDGLVVVAAVERKDVPLHRDRERAGDMNGTAAVQQIRSRQDGRAVPVGAIPILPSGESAVLRDQLLSEIKRIDSADAADDGDEDHIGGPIVDVESGGRRNAQLLQSEAYP